MKTNLLQSTDEKNFQKAVGKELYASNHYLYSASCAQRGGWTGSQKYFEKEAEDERVHYLKIRNFLNDRGSEAEMPEIPEVELKEGSLTDLYKQAYDLEVDLGTFYNDWFNDTRDATVKVFLIKMIEIQTKSIGEYGDLLARIDKVGEPLFDIEIGKA